VHAGDPRPARCRRRRGRRDPQGRRPDHPVGRDARDHGAERVRQVHPRLLDRRAPEVRGDLRQRPARRRGRAVHDRRRAGPRGAVPGHAVPGRGARGLGVELPAHRGHRGPRRGAEAAHLGQGGQRRDVRAGHGQGVRRAQPERGLLRRREEAARDPAARAAQAEVRDPRRDRLRPGHRRAAGGLRRHQPHPGDRCRHAADHPLHAHPAVREAGLRARLRGRADRRAGRPRAGRGAGALRVRAVHGGGVM
ncbi:MAG: Iron-sulfur cluster assembly ATPase protein SufC, partial [uncultured Corynebacteriales bacterium]